MACRSLASPRLALMGLERIGPLRLSLGSAGSAALEVREALEQRWTRPSLFGQKQSMCCRRLNFAIGIRSKGRRSRKAAKRKLPRVIRHHAKTGESGA